MTHKNERVLSVAELARVEGEGALYVRTSGNKVEEARLDIYEPPRFFEAFLRGRAYTEPPDITARICGICPVAYQMSACTAIEAACGVTVDGPIADLRRLLYCGEWIESHALHIYLLHAPDFLGYSSGIEMATHRRDLVERGLALKKAGNAIMEAVGGRAIHPINVRIGGFYRAPARAELAPLTEPLRRALDVALDAVRWVSGFDFPDHACATGDMLAMSRPGTYAIERGTLVTRSGLAFPAAEWDEHVIEEQVPHSTALHAHLAGGGRYLTGPLARYSLGSQWLSPLAREAARAAGLGETCDNPFRSIIVRAVETVYAVEEALRLIAAYSPPDPPAVEVRPRARRRLRRHRGTPGDPVPPVRDRRGRPHHHRPHHPADVPEPGGHRGRPAGLRGSPDRPGRRRAHPPVRAGDPQLRPVHILRDPLPRSHRRKIFIGPNGWWFPFLLPASRPHQTERMVVPVSASGFAPTSDRTDGGSRFCFRLRAR